MKKSNVLLIIMGVLITTWFVVFEVICARAVDDIANGRKSRLGFYDANTRPDNNGGKRSAIPLTPFRDLEIIAENDVSVILQKGDRFSVWYNNDLVKTKKIWYQGSKLNLFLAGERKKYNVVTLVVPSVSSVTCYNLRELTLKGIDQKSLSLSACNVYSLIVENCRIGSFLLNNNDATGHKFITIDCSNRFDTLGLLIRGEGTLVLNCAGLNSNNALISDSIDIRSNIRTLRKLRLQ